MRTGFPPATLDAPETDPISKLLSQGDLLIVQPHSNSSTQSATHSTAPPQSKTQSQSKLPPPPRSSLLSNGTLKIREVPDDNSCLFRAVNGVLSRPHDSPRSLRSIVRDVVAADPGLYSEAFLGKSNQAYQQWITSDNAWGGAIELSILSQRFRIQFAAFDVKTMRLDRYGEANSFPTVGYLIYDGIHYNYIALALASGLDLSADITQFDVKDPIVEQHVRALVQIENDARRFTDTASFLLRCGQCSAKFKGENEALEHAKSTGHTDFTEK